MQIFIVLVGGQCGSSYLDLAFERYIKSIVGEKQYKWTGPEARKKMMQEWEMSVKRSFSGDEEWYSVPLQGIENDRRNDIYANDITIKP